MRNPEIAMNKLEKLEGKLENNVCDAYSPRHNS
jgi:hypothetical protein